MARVFFHEPLSKLLNEMHSMHKSGCNGNQKESLYIWHKTSSGWPPSWIQNMLYPTHRQICPYLLIVNTSFKWPGREFKFIDKSNSQMSDIVSSWHLYSLIIYEKLSMICSVTCMICSIHFAVFMHLTKAILLSVFLILS